MPIRRKHHKHFFYGLLVLIGLASLRVLQPYLSLVILSFITATLFRSAYLWWYRLFGERDAFAVTATLLTAFFTVLIPFAILINISVYQVLAVNRDLQALDLTQSSLSIDQLVTTANGFLASLPGVSYRVSLVELEASLQNLVAPIGRFALEHSASIGASSATFVTNAIIFLILFSSFLTAYEPFLAYIRRLSPLDDQLDNRYLNRVLAMAKSMIKGTVVIAVVQGVVAGILLWIAGVPYVLFLTMVMIFMGIIPLGAGIIAFPAGILLLALGNIWQGTLVLAGQIIVVNNLDNVLRPKLVSEEAQLHPALLLLGVFGGLRLFGFWGVVYGPVVMILLTTTLEIYLEQYR